MSQNPLYVGMQFTEDRATIAEWMPLVMAGRDDNTPVAATRMDLGTEVDWGTLTRQLGEQPGQPAERDADHQHGSTWLERNDDNTWRITVANIDSGETSVVKQPLCVQRRWRRSLAVAAGIRHSQRPSSTLASR